MENIIKGTAFVFNQNDIDTDLIIPARYLTTSDEKQLALHVLEPLRKNNELLQASGLLKEENAQLQTDKTTTKHKQYLSPIVLAGENFGCGSSREHAIWALRGASVKVVIAKSFARIFLRNAINNGFLAIESPDVLDKIKNKDLLEIKLKEGLIINLSQNIQINFHKIPDFVLKISEKGGLLNTIK